MGDNEPVTRCPPDDGAGVRRLLLHSPDWHSLLALPTGTLSPLAKLPRTG